MNAEAMETPGKCQKTMPAYDRTTLSTAYHAISLWESWDGHLSLS